MTNRDRIHTHPMPNCKLCGSIGNKLYSGLRDALFGTTGAWSQSRCANPECGLIWLDPAPREEDIGLAYQSYYTHGGAAESKTSKHRLMSLGLRIMVNLTLLGSGLSRQRNRASSMYLDDQPTGRLLEIGCGEGAFLHRMHIFGWRVEGLDSDPVAAKTAHRKYSLPVKAGKLEDMGYPSNSYDAVTMSHVFEHMFDPIGVLKEIHRILKPDGRLVIVTPNANSLGHQKFGRYWRGLEPPRHIQIFTPKALLRAASVVGLLPIRTETTAVNAWIILSASSILARIKDEDRMQGLRRPGALDLLKALALQLQESRLNRRSNEIGEECILVVRKGNFK